MVVEDKTASVAWFQQVERLMLHGVTANPRGKRTRELLGERIVVSMRYPIVLYWDRKLSYQFMAAEALWIINGSNRLNFNPQIMQKLSTYSNDGKTMDGAYGPPFADQLSYVTQKLTEDPDTRQAVVTIWRPRPAASKDVPCTVALQFLIRDGALNTNVFMRSSDVWLGIPYDLFSFTIMSAVVALRSGVKQLNNLTLFLGSSHMYESNLEAVKSFMAKRDLPLSASPLSIETMTEHGLELLLELASSQKTNRDAMGLLTSWGDAI